MSFITNCSPQATEELEGVRSLHDETVRSWHSERQASAQQLEELQGAVKAAREALEVQVGQAEAASQRALQNVTELTVDRETLQKKLDRFVGFILVYSRHNQFGCICRIMKLF